MCNPYIQGTTVPCDSVNKLCMHPCINRCICTCIFRTSQVAGRKSASMELQYKGHQIQPHEAVLLLVAESRCGISGTSVAFQLHGRVTGVKPQVSYTYMHIHNEGTSTCMCIHIHAHTCYRHAYTCYSITRCKHTHYSPSFPPLVSCAGECSSLSGADCDSAGNKLFQDSWPV